ncbi:3-dehydroquinate synthase [Dyadobacter sp. BE34]|uniref:3-dehydroquinate synthase n=1 Tax=Dyadobacter TaxID=120831 RepID=UPI00285AA977|nr:MULTISPECIES: 3-dehydroquinate synthase [Dyadobacter]MDR7199877.1 3-dehydroquinate synthase [Dyadobacter sp. BE34]MDR7217664.1 3-dehydroquinate synthase [Dyadobacter sp. BE31]
MNQSVVIAPIGESLPDFLSSKQYSKIVVIADNNTKRHCYPILKAFLPKHSVVTVPSGEAHKTLATCEKIWEAMTKDELDRHALVINVGGGVIGDMGGFCAAVYKRGIDFIQVPTTLLSQVDASVGGKLGIDFQGFKNHLGVFNIPKSVLIDPVFLKTLPEREIRSGFAEIIKHCLIADGAKWEEIRAKDFEAQQWPDLIAHSVKIKQQVVDQDPTEKGLRKILNFGHTLGHAVETCFLNKGPKERLFHGEAIAVGMIMEAYLSFERKMIDQQTLTNIEEFLFATYGKVKIKPEDIEEIIALTRQDKKNKGKEIRFSLLKGAGQCAFDIVVTATEMRRSIAYYLG